MMNTLLDAYQRHASDHGKHTLQGDAEATNAAYDHLRNTFVAIVKAGYGHELFRFYDETDPWVQLWAAAHTLEIDEARALAKLRERVNARIPHISTSAKYTIQGWKNGELRFLPLE
jgi:hypothetical protein